LASAAAKVIDTMLGRSERVVTCFVAPDDSAGRRARTAAMPVRLNRAGLGEVVLPELSGRDRVRLDNAIQL
jgi:malate/lactate dehydrogenase